MPHSSPVNGIRIDELASIEQRIDEIVKDFGMPSQAQLDRVCAIFGGAL